MPVTVFPTVGAISGDTRCCIAVAPTVQSVVELIRFTGMTNIRARVPDSTQPRERFMTDVQASHGDDPVSLRVLEALDHGVVVTDAAERVVYLNPAAAALTGRSAGSAVGQPLSKVLACVDPADRRPAPILVDGGESDRCNGDGRLLLRGDGGEAIISDTVTVLRDADGAHTGYVVVIQDARHLRELVYQATHDPLTGLMNRREFERRLWLAVEESRRDGVVMAWCTPCVSLIWTVSRASTITPGTPPAMPCSAVWHAPCACSSVMVTSSAAWAVTSSESFCGTARWR